VRNSSPNLASRNCQSSAKEMKHSELGTQVKDDVALTPFMRRSTPRRDDWPPSRRFLSQGFPTNRPASRQSSQLAATFAPAAYPSAAPSAAIGDAVRPIPILPGNLIDATQPPCLARAAASHFKAPAARAGDRPDFSFGFTCLLAVSLADVCLRRRGRSPRSRTCPPGTHASPPATSRLRRSPNVVPLQD
jgi:hypothetical protein